MYTIHYQNNSYLHLLWKLDLNIEPTDRINPVEPRLQGGEGSVVQVNLDKLLQLFRLLRRMINPNISKQNKYMLKTTYTNKNTEKPNTF